ncbi:MAG TPA: HEAT repeat domain-containing protein [Planctomycetota bacterium]|nr:HEAT repeat domain-containing protein [Planctomycetota bacterium]
MVGRLLDRWRERKALKSVEGALRGRMATEEALAALRDLPAIASLRSIPTLCLLLTHGQEALRAEACAALAAIYRRRQDQRVLEALNAAILFERQPDSVRTQAIEALAGIVHTRHVGSLIEVLKKATTPLPVRTAALHALERLGYPEVVERLVENCLLARSADSRGELRAWVVEQLKALDDKEKLTKIHEIVHNRRRLRYRAMSVEAGDHATLVQLMAEVDPDHAVRFLGHMVDHSTTIISAAAVKALREIRADQKTAADRAPRTRPSASH